MEAPDRLNRALERARAALLAEWSERGCWEGRLSDSALATAVASLALKKGGRMDLAAQGKQWLLDNRNADGGWGDSPESPSNFTATLLCRSVLGEEDRSPAEIRSSILGFYGDDRTFSVPILTMCRLTGALDDWADVPQLPFELAVLPHRFYKWLQLPVVSYALPALIAVGLVRHKNAPTKRWPLRKLRDALTPKVLEILGRIQPESGGFLEAAPLTSFVAMSLMAAGFSEHPVTQACLRFLETTVRPDGGWPIDVNLSTWVTSLAARALGDDLSAAQREQIRDHLLSAQWKAEHPFTHAAPGGWAWTDRSGGVPDADDTAAALIALQTICRLDRNDAKIAKDSAGIGRPSLCSLRLRGEKSNAVERGISWLLDLQNRDGGMPTFCKGWGKLPFDRSCPDLTAHALRAFAAWRPEMSPDLQRRMDGALRRGFGYLRQTQRADGSWVPLWFGNQQHPQKENPVYGTARVVEALLELETTRYPQAEEMLTRGLTFLLTAPCNSVEELALVVGLTGQRSNELLEVTAEGRAFPASPIGLYFASLWYSEKLYPLIFTVEGLKRYTARMEAKSE